MNRDTNIRLVKASVAIAPIALLVPSSLFRLADVLESHRPLLDLDNVSHLAVP